ncbi:ribonuclease HI family protein [Arthrobacter sp. CJ23]|uniref:ribonuclease HI family protein n=1 Tax=Arthrobacter sp. CJ23 TaxID=2972479 RepID=UPI00215D20DC|nr:ribonuclease HI family protein [Arthrobacter sp. CJ23]UVJ40401.1 ribonuclease HI family protein [Arthrobacter sp. CJ23]
MTIIAAADGSALGNPGPAGWAWYVDDSCWRAGGWPHGTNNQGELMAVLDLFRSTAHLPQEELRILCDSQYVINCISKWMPGWKRKGWRKADGKPVLNLDLLKEIDQAVVGRKYTFEWVKGHAGHPLNEAADDRARAVATAYQQKSTAPQGPGFPGAPATSNGTAPSQAAPAIGTAAAAGEPTLFGSLAPSVQAAPVSRPDLFNQPEQFNQPDLFSEPDLFSDFDEEAPAGQEVSAEDVVVALERELLQPEVRADIGRTGVLLHPDFTEIGSSGRLWTRDAMMMELEGDPGESTELELLGADRLNEGTVLLNYRSHGRAGSALRSSVWLLDGGRWRLRFHQGTPEN